MKRIIDIDEDYFEIIKHDVKNGQDYKPFVLIANSIPYEEKPHGKWIEQTDCVGDTYYECSFCKEPWTTIEGTPWNNGMKYCPNCGAKMDGGEES